MTTGYTPIGKVTSEKLFHRKPLGVVPPINDDSRMPIGMYRGYRMTRVPASYLKWLYENGTNLRPDLKAYIHRNIKKINGQILHDRKFNKK